jgi:hypothetical protein
VHTLGDLRRRQEDVRLLAIGLRPAAEVSDLGEHQAFVVVHGVGNRAVRRDDGSSGLAICFHAAAGDEG